MERSSASECFKESPLSADSGCETSPPGANFSIEANEIVKDGCSASVLDDSNADSEAFPCVEGPTCPRSSDSTTAPPSEHPSELHDDGTSTSNVNLSHCPIADSATSTNGEFVQNYNTYQYPLSYSYPPNDYAFYYPGQHSVNEFPCYSSFETPSIGSSFETLRPLLYGRTDDPSQTNYFQWAQFQPLNSNSSTVVSRFPVYSCTYPPSAEPNNYAFSCDNVNPDADASHESQHASTHNSNFEVQAKPFSVDPSLACNSCSNFIDHNGCSNKTKSLTSRGRRQTSVLSSKPLVHVQRRYSVPNHRVYSRPSLSPPPLELRRRSPTSATHPSVFHGTEDGGGPRDFANRRHSAPPEQFWSRWNAFSNDRRPASALHGPRSGVVNLEERRASVDANFMNYGWNSNESASRNAKSMQPANILVSPKHGSTRAKNVMKQYNFYQRLDLPHDCLGKPLLLSTDPRSPRNVDAVWREHIALLFRNLRETWLISRAPDTFKPSELWLVSKDVAKVRFYCRRCCDGWTSMYGVVVFYYRRNVLSSRSRTSQPYMDDVQSTAENTLSRDNEQKTSYSGCSYSGNERHFHEVEAEANRECSSNRPSYAASVDRLDCTSGLSADKLTDSYETNDVNNLDVNNNLVKDDFRYSKSNLDSTATGVDSKLGFTSNYARPAEAGSRCTGKPDGSLGWGEVLYKVAGQKCSRCSPQVFEMPLWYADEAQKVITNLYYAVARTLYGLCTPSPIRTRRLGQPSYHHNAGLCQGCITGLCKADLCAASADARTHLSRTGHAEALKSLEAHQETLLDGHYRETATNRPPGYSEMNANRMSSRELRSPVLNHTDLMTSESMSQGEIKRRQTTQLYNLGSYADQTLTRKQNGLRNLYAVRVQDRKNHYSQNGEGTGLSAANASVGPGMETISSGNGAMDNEQSPSYQSLSLARVHGSAYRLVPSYYSPFSQESSYSGKDPQAAGSLHFWPSLSPPNYSAFLASQDGKPYGTSLTGGHQLQASRPEQLPISQPSMMAQAPGLQPLPLPEHAGLGSQNLNSFQCLEARATQDESIIIPCQNFASVPFAHNAFHY